MKPKTYSFLLPTIKGTVEARVPGPSPPRTGHVTWAASVPSQDLASLSITLDNGDPVPPCWAAQAFGAQLRKSEQTNPHLPCVLPSQDESVTQLGQELAQKLGLRVRKAYKRPQVGGPWALGLGWGWGLGDM